MKWLSIFCCKLFTKASLNNSFHRFAAKCLAMHQRWRSINWLTAMSENTFAECARRHLRDRIICKSFNRKLASSCFLNMNQLFSYRNGHMLTHRNKKPYECKAEGCGKSYCDARSLRRHTENHHSSLVLTTSTTSSQNQSHGMVSNNTSSGTSTITNPSLSPATASGNFSFYTTMIRLWSINLLYRTILSQHDFLLYH